MLKLLFALLNAAKLGPLLKTGGTMLLSVGAYALLLGWRYAVGFVLLIFCHEMGHFLAARHRGLAVGAPTFIPFVGAWIELKQLPHDVETEAYVGIAGPVVGTLATLVCFVFAVLGDSTLLLALAYAGFMLNLFNLIPLSPFDGGRITAIISPRVWLLGVPLLGALFFVSPSPMLILIALLAAPQVWAVLRGRAEAAMPAGYYETPTALRLRYAVWYLGLAAFLALMSHEVHLRLGQELARG
ncbi:MAG: site-2 protease family protein [Gammaproteobacteria bacterium]|nr:site-2 protease family protein [Gammaproteobacteria bacterium]